MHLRALEGPITGPFTPLAELTPRTAEQIEKEIVEAHREIDELVDRRREAGAPLPPGDCQPEKPPGVTA